MPAVGSVRSWVIPRKKRRRIVVGGRPFVYAFPARRPNSVWSDPANIAMLTVQEASSRPGRVSQCFIHFVHGDPVTPEAIAIVIKRMLSAGWDPSERGPSFRIDSVDVRELDVQFVRNELASEVMES